jgi:hypothetical protein
MQGDTMRKIDAKAYNKRLHSELMHLSQMLDMITPENLEKLDASLVGSTLEYVDLISKCQWSDNSNFNGFEMSKIKQALSSLSSSSFEYFVGFQQKMIPVDKAVGATLRTVVDIPEGYDGRQSFVHMSFSVLYLGSDLDGYISENREANVKIDPYNEAHVSNSVAKSVIRKNRDKIVHEGRWASRKPPYRITETLFYILWRNK